jgi:hypothetical protein
MTGKEAGSGVGGELLISKQIRSELIWLTLIMNMA